MIRTSGRWLWSHRYLTLGLVLLTSLALLNLVAYRHAHAMTHYAPEGTATAKPESLSTLQKVRVLWTGVTVPRPSCGGVMPQDVGLPFTVHRFQGQGNVELEAWHVPHPQPRGLVLMFHGYAACKAALLAEAAALHELGYALFLVDFRGSGGSSGSETTIGVQEADDVASAVAYVRAHWDDSVVILYGQSMGSVAALRAVAVLGVRPAALILECPFDRLVNTVGNRFQAMGLPAFPGAQLLVFWGGWQHHFNGFAHNPVEYATQVNCPALLLHGANDPRVTPEQAQAVYRGLRGKKAFELFADLGHQSYAAGRPERWKRVIADFLTPHAPCPSPPPG